MEMNQECLKIHIQNKNMVPVAEFAESLNAIAAEFQAFCDGKDRDCNAELMLKEVRKGSIEVLLTSSVAFLLPIAEGFNTIVEFGKHLKGVFHALSQKSPAEVGAFSNETLENVKNIIAPIAKDSGGNVNISVEGNGNSVIIGGFNSDSARQCIQKAQYMQDMTKLPECKVYEKEVLYFTQIRDAKGNVGDRAVIDKFSKNPTKVIYVDPEFKTQVRASEGNIFNYGFVVDVEVSTIGKKIAAYKVLRFHERFDI